MMIIPSSAEQRLGIPGRKLELLVKAGVLPGRYRTGMCCGVFLNEDELLGAELALQTLGFIAVVTPENWERLEADSLAYTLLTRRQTEWKRVLREGHRIAVYCTGVSSFVGLASILGPPQEETVVWPSAVFTLRVPLAPEVLLPKGAGVPVKSLIPALSFIKTKEKWGQYFRSSLRPVSAEDFEIIASALRSTAYQP